LRIVLLRDAERGGALAARLRARGHEGRCVPLLAVEAAGPFPDPAGFDGVLFTSANAVARAPSGARWPRVGAVGAATASALRARGIPVHVTGAGGGADLAAAWGPARGQRLLLPQAEAAHPALAEALRRAGADVVRAPVYRSVAALLLRALAGPRLRRSPGGAGGRPRRPRRHDGEGPRSLRPPARRPRPRRLPRRFRDAFRDGFRDG
jgi:uroporphyrinogen-III synthase